MLKGLVGFVKLLYMKTALCFSITIFLILEILINYALNQLYNSATGKCTFDVIPASIVTGINTCLIYGSVLVFALILPMAIYAIYLACKKNDKWVEIWTAGLYRIMAAQLCLIIIVAIWAFWAATVLIMSGTFEVVISGIIIFMLPAVFVFASKALDIKGFVRMVKA